MAVAVGISYLSSLGAELLAFKSVKAAILAYPLPVWLYSIHTSPIGMLDPKNMGIAVGISLLSCLQAEITIMEITDGEI